MIVAGVLGLASPALAHPFGQKPVITVARAGTSVGVRWIIAPDDFDALTEQLALGPVTPTAAGDDTRFRRYVLARLRVEQDGRRCGGRVDGVRPDPAGFVTDVLYECTRTVERVLMTVRLLHDISRDYVTLVRAGTGTAIVRDVLTASSPAMTIDFAASASIVGTPAPATKASRTDRILASIRGGSGLMAAVGLAFILGMLHGITPGHGKTIAAAYLVGSGGTVRHSLALSGVVTSTHAASTALIAAVPLALGQQQPPAALTAWLEVGAGVLIVVLGVALLRRPHTHAHPTEGSLPLRRLAGIGFAGGLVPNPEALLVVLGAFSLHRWTAGVAMIGAFSIGLGVVVLGIAIAAVRGRGLLARLSQDRFLVLAPRIAAALFLIMGVAVATTGALNV